MFPLICVWITAWVNNREAIDLRCHRAHCDVIVMTIIYIDPGPFRKNMIKFLLNEFILRLFRHIKFKSTQTIYSSETDSIFPLRKYYIQRLKILELASICRHNMEICITLTSLWARLRLKSPASQLFIKPFVQICHIPWRGHFSVIIQPHYFFIILLMHRQRMQDSSKLLIIEMKLSMLKKFEHFKPFRIIREDLRFKIDWPWPSNASDLF